MSSIYTTKTSLSSILKTYSPSEREKAKDAIINKVRFEMPKQKGLVEVINAVLERNHFQPMNEFVSFLCDCPLDDAEFLRVLTDARKVVNDLSPKFTNLVEALLSLPWTKRTPQAVQAYIEFFIDIMVTHSKYLNFGIPKLITLWIPADTEAANWHNGGVPVKQIYNELEAIHLLLNRIVIAIPMSVDVILNTVERMFPYYKKAPHIVVGYVHNVLWLMEYQPIFTEYVMKLLLHKMLILDVNAPRSEIEEAECEDEEDDETDMQDDADEEIFEMDDCKKETAEESPMNHPIAQTLDICMDKLFAFLDTKNPNATNLTEDEKLRRQVQASQFFKVLLKTFHNIILPSHNTHHAQFLMFYYCSFKATLAEDFLNSLWEKVKNPNVAPNMRQAAVSYIASFLARSKFLSIYVIKDYLKELCEWAHQYIERSDQYRANGSLKANLVFYTVCQTIFYVIAFRSRDLTADKKSLHFLQSLQLSALVTCNFNPLRVCLPAVATTFAGVTRAYQLAYCHAILERNARRKLATVYANDTSTPEEILDTFFPFDPYLLKISGKRIAPHYLKYQASEAEEQNTATTSAASHNMRLKRNNDTEMIDDLDIDDFILADKRRKLIDLARSQEREAQFTYSVSPGFHT